MSEILSKWLNDDVQLSQTIEPKSFAQTFANGYLFGELLYQHGLQDDFQAFSTGKSSEARLNNFSRIEPVLALLDVKFDSNMAKEIIEERPGMATRLLYQLFIALGKKTKMNLTGVAMETMRPQGPARLGVIETEMYKERLKTLIPRQIDLDFDDLVAKYNKKQQENEEKAVLEKIKQEEESRNHQQALRQQRLERSKKMTENQENVMKKIEEATVKIPKPPEKKKKDGLIKANVLKQNEIESVYKNIDSFEKKLKNMRTISSPQSSDQIREIDADIELFLNDPNHQSKEMKISDLVKPELNDTYIQKIRNQLNEDVYARKEREKRRRRVLVQQLQAHEAQQEAVREEELVNRLMRQSQMERRIAVQLMHIRNEKETIKRNRMEMEKQFTERRLMDFQQALDREAEYCRLARLEYEEEVRKNKEIHNAIAAERARKKYEKHFAICKEILLDIVDFSCKVGEYREITEKKLPPKQVREWKTLFMNSKPLYDEPLAEELTDEERDRMEMEESKKSLLDEEDFLEYKNFVGEWIPCEGSKQPPDDNAVLGYILKRLNDILYPPTPPPDVPVFPPFPIKACVLGKFFSGKSSAVRSFAASHRVKVLEIDTEVSESLEAWKNEEKVEGIDEDEQNSEENKQENIEPKPPKPVEVKQEVVKETLSVGDGEDFEPASSETQGGETTKENGNPSSNPSSRPVTFNNPEPSASTESLKLSQSKEKMLTERAKLGGKVNHFLRKGKVVPDILLVEIMVNAIRNLPEGTGWIMDGFPSTAPQAKLLEKALSGYEAVPSPQKSATKEAKRNKRSKLASDPTPPTEAKAPISGIDVVIFFDVPDDMVLQRIEGRSYDPKTGEEYHEEFNPPTDGGYTGLQTIEKIQSVVDLSNDKEQAQIRLTTFQDSWPKLEKWLNRFQNVLQVADAKLPKAELADHLEQRLEEVMQKLVEAEQTAKEEEERLRKEKVEQLEKEHLEKEKSEVESTDANKTDGDMSLENSQVSSLGGDNSNEGATASTGKQTPSKTNTKKGAKKDGKDSPSPAKKAPSASPKKGKGKDKKEKEKEARSPSPHKKRSDSKRSISSKPSSIGSRGKTGSKESIMADEEKVEIPSRPPSPLPGSLEWAYVDQPIDTDFVNVLLSNWENIEDIYIKSCKHIFRSIRHENENVLQYFYRTRKSYIEFLQRPDAKQIFVSEWQKDYNAFPEDIRGDEEVKAELHQRVEDLCDRLWDICDNRKEEAENERETIMTEKWLEDHLAFLVNHFLSLMQCEVGRYQETCRLLKDYYVAMEGGVGPEKVKILQEANLNFARLPLVDIPISEKPFPPTQENAPATEDEQSGNVAGSNVSPVASLPTTPKNMVRTPDIITSEAKDGRIPLVPRTGITTDNSPTRDRKSRATPRKDRSSDEKLLDGSPLPPPNAEEKLLMDGFNAVLQAVEQQAAYDAQEEENHENSKQEKVAPVELTKTQSKDKKGKKDRKSPTKSKTIMGQTTPVPSMNTIDPMNEEDKAKQLLHDKMKKEYKHAVNVEGVGLQSRLEAVKTHASNVIKKLKEKAEDTYLDLDNWLGARFLQEMESIDKMCEVIRQAIENETQLQDASILEDKVFFIDVDLHVFKTPTPPLTPPPTEDLTPITFTCLQIEALNKQFRQIAPVAMVSVKMFNDVMLSLPSLTVGSEALPEVWQNITSQQLEEITQAISINNEYINWKSFLIHLSKPYPEPTHRDLHQSLNAFKSRDEASIGMITREDYLMSEIWIDEHRSSEHTDGFDRLQHLKNMFFDIFALESSEGDLLNYLDMLLYFTKHDDPLIGLHQALCLITDTFSTFPKYLQQKIPELDQPILA
ncbi:sperm flagellar protein 2-like isoform X2 [Clytia hemisphaerica]|uniref:sperm flagellar protein 2-like isoform X2 n=1 Tax=Clytia hemisphaerica TaxID=252671 RepID=UPI0034D6D62B